MRGPSLVAIVLLWGLVLCSPGSVAQGGPPLLPGDPEFPIGVAFLSIDNTTASSTYIEVGEEVTLLGSLHNAWNASVNASWSFNVDGQLVGTPVPFDLPAGGSLPLQATWVAIEGEHQVGFVILVVRQGEYIPVTYGTWQLITVHPAPTIDLATPLLGIIAVVAAAALLAIVPDPRLRRRR